MQLCDSFIHLRLCHLPLPVFVSFYLEKACAFSRLFSPALHPSHRKPLEFPVTPPPRCAETSGAETNEKIILSVKVLDVLSATPKVLQLKTQMEAAAAFALQVFV